MKNCPWCPRPRPQVPASQSPTVSVLRAKQVVALNLQNKISALNGPPRTDGAKVGNLRRARGWPQRFLAIKVGVSRSYIGLVETDNTNPSEKLLVKIAEALEVSADYIRRKPTVN